MAVTETRLPVRIFICAHRPAGSRSRSRSGSRPCCRIVLFPNYLSLASQIAIAALFALSLDLILGYAGIVSLGHAAFFGIGAYAAGLLSKYGWGEPMTGLAAAALAAGIVGYVTSFIICRFRHLALIMITLGLRPAAAGGGQQRGLADRRHGRPAGHPHLAAARLFPVRSLRLHRL